MALSLYKHNQYGTLSYEQVDSNWSQIESDVNGLSARLPLNNYAATTDPAVNDDVTQGYSNGSLWYNRTTDTAFILTNASSGAANWVERDSISASDLGSAAFADIVGTVSQSGGVPTGALVETGSNANGKYWKYSGGMTICSAGIVFDATDPNVQTFDLPSPFNLIGGKSASLTLNININGSGSAFDDSFNVQHGLTQFEWRCRINPGHTGTVASLPLNLFAVGRWY